MFGYLLAAIDFIFSVAIVVTLLLGVSMRFIYNNIFKVSIYFYIEYAFFKIFDETSR